MSKGQAGPRYWLSRHSFGSATRCGLKQMPLVVSSGDRVMPAIIAPGGEIGNCCRARSINASRFADVVGELECTVIVKCQPPANLIKITFLETSFPIQS